MKPETELVIKKCLKFNGGRSRPDKSMPLMLPYLLQCKSILDVGCGRGSLGWVVKTENPSIEMRGIEVHFPYINNVTREFYEHIEIADYTKVFKDRPAECVVLMDVLEHFPHDSAVSIIEHLTASGSKIIVSIPVAPIHWHQDEGFEKANPHEAHLYDWTVEELKKLGLTHVGTNQGLGVFVHGF